MSSTEYQGVLYFHQINSFGNIGLCVVGFNDWDLYSKCKTL